MKAEKRREIDALLSEAKAVFSPAAVVVRPDPVAWAGYALGFDLDPWQGDVMRSEAPTIAVVCARQTGKSTTTGAKVANELAFTPGIHALLIAPTFRQSRWLAEKVLAPLRAHGIAVDATQERIVLPNGSFITVAHGDRPDTVRGPAVDLLVIDEAAFIKAALFAAVLPMLAATRGRLVCLSSPNGRSGDFYEMTLDPSVETFRVRAADVSRFDPAQIAAIRRRIGPHRAAQELDAEFVVAAGGVFSGDALAAMFGEQLFPLGPSDEAVANAEADLNARWDRQNRRSLPYGGNIFADGGHASPLN